MSDTEGTLWGEIDGRRIVFPVEVTDANIATLTYSVPTEAAARLLPGTAFEIAESAPGVAQLVLAACDYRANPWGDYNELNFGFLARPVGASADTVGSFVYRMPVDQEFTCAAGNAVMGFPKTVERIDVTYTESTVTFVLAHPDPVTGAITTALTLTLPRAAPLGDPARVDATTYSYLDGVPYQTPLSMDMGTGFVDDPSAVVLELGEGVLADELRSLGLPCPPDFCAWGEGLSATFHLGSPL